MRRKGPKSRSREGDAAAFSMRGCLKEAVEADYATDED